MQHFCRKYTMPRNEKTTRARGWILKNTRIGPVLDIKVCHHEDQYTIEVLVKSLFQDRTASCVGIVNGVDKYVTESMPAKEEGDIASGKPIAKARPRQKPTVTLTPVSILVRDRRWTDIETQRSNDQKFFDVSKAITRLPRHDQTVRRDIDGAIQCNGIIEKLDGASQWPLEEWISTVAKGGGGDKKRFQYCLNPNSSNQFLYLRAIQGHSRDNALKKWTDSRREKPQRGRQAVFFTTVNTMEDGHSMGETPRDPTKPRIAPYKNTWKRLKNTGYWCNLKFAHEKGLHCFTEHGHVQSFSTTHYLQLPFRKRYV